MTNIHITGYTIEYYRYFEPTNVYNDPVYLYKYIIDSLNTSLTSTT
jgi:hypothetical protein